MKKYLLRFIYIVPAYTFIQKKENSREQFFFKWRKTY